MSKILLGAAAIAAIAFGASSAYAMGGGGPTPPSASPYAILEPQTVYPGLAAPSAMFEGRSAFTGEYGALQPRSDVSHARGHRSRHHGLGLEQ
jgi:hypothetical protein